MDAARLMEKLTRFSAISVPNWLRRSIAWLSALRIHCSTPGPVDWPIDLSRLLIACRTELMLSVTRSPEWFTIRLTWPIPNVNSQISSARERISSRSTGIMTAGLRFILIFFCRKRITGCSAAATGIEIIKGDSLSHTSGTIQCSAASTRSRPSSLSSSRSAAFLSSLIRSPPRSDRFPVILPLSGLFCNCSGVQAGVGRRFGPGRKIRVLTDQTGN